VAKAIISFFSSKVKKAHIRVLFNFCSVAFSMKNILPPGLLFRPFIQLMFMAGGDKYDADAPYP